MGEGGGRSNSWINQDFVVLIEAVQHRQGHRGHKTLVLNKCW